MDITRIRAGLYRATAADGRVVTIERRDDLDGWMAVAEFDRYLYSDPLRTYAAAKRVAAAMLE